MKILDLVLLFTILVSNSCISINVPNGFTSGYEKLNENQKSKIVFGAVNYFNGSLDSVYVTNSASLMRSLTKTDSTIIYIWSPNCTSLGCPSLGYLQALCNKGNYRLLVVSEYFDFDKFKQVELLQNPILIIDHNYYKTKITHRYVAKFKNELVERTNKPEVDISDRLYLFYHNNFSKAIDLDYLK